MQPTFAQEIASGQRFKFGKNWASFLRELNEARIKEAENSLKDMLKIHSLKGQSFIDVGCGSGLFSLAARRLGASVYSFDYDPESVACASYLKDKFFREDDNWTVAQGSALDVGYIRTLGTYDIVYSWGVLHHTGAMWEALGNVAKLVRPNGLLFIAIYNDQGWISRYWHFIKRLNNQGVFFKILVFMVHFPYFFVLVPLVQVVKGKFKLRRGMSRWHDVLDWLGGYPFEVSKPEEVFKFYRNIGFELAELSTCGGRHGCNQYIFKAKH